MPQKLEFMLSRRGFLAFGLLFFPAFQAVSSRVRFLDFDRVEPLLASNRLPLPPALAGSAGQVRAAWGKWIQTHDREIRSRLLRGEEDTLVNFVLFGVSFSDRPRVRLVDAGSSAGERLISDRIQDFIVAVSKPNTERLTLLDKLLTRLGYRASTSTERDRLRQYLMQSVSRYLAETQQYRSNVERAMNNDTTQSLNATAQLYKTRGLSFDTDFRPNYAIEQALVEVKRRGLLKTVRRAAIVGPGLDFTDKDSGFDYYPLQTLQPFALIDSLVRQGLAQTSNLRVGVFDISDQTLDHISQAQTRARARQSYTLQLVRDRTPAWSAAALAYWGRLGERIGTPADPMPTPSQVQNVDRRAIRIRPEIVTTLDPMSLNIISQHVETPANQRFDLIVATNIFLYYDRFEQALALLNLEAMLNTGGVLLTNDLFEDFAGIRLRTVGSVPVNYTASQSDQVRIYSTPTFQPQLPPG